MLEYKKDLGGKEIVLVSLRMENGVLKEELDLVKDLLKWMKIEM